MVQTASYVISRYGVVHEAKANGRPVCGAEGIFVPCTPDGQLLNESVKDGRAEGLDFTYQRACRRCP